MLLHQQFLLSLPIFTILYIFFPRARTCWGKEKPQESTLDYPLIFWACPLLLCIFLLFLRFPFDCVVFSILRNHFLYLGFSSKNLKPSSHCPVLGSCMCEFSRVRTSSPQIYAYCKVKRAVCAGPASLPLAGKAEQHKLMLTDLKHARPLTPPFGVDIRGNRDPADTFFNVCRTAFANVNLTCKHMEPFTVNGFSLL